MPFCRSVVLVLSVGSVLAGCASKPRDIHAAYVSPLTYKDYSCRQLLDEADRLSHEASRSFGVQQRQRTTDTVLAVTGVVFVPIAIAFIEGDGVKAAEVARIKGQMHAIEEASEHRKSGCRISFTQH
jgi:hypothetical protein